MPISVKCKGCKNTLRVRDDLAGKKVKCPKCANLLVVPAVDDEEDFIPVEVVPEQRVRKAPAEPRKARPRRDEPEDEDEDEDDRDDRRGRDRDRDRDHRRSGIRPERPREDRRSAVRTARDSDRGERRRDRDDREDEDDRDDRDRKAKYKPCPQCGARGARRVTWTPWGSFYGPAMFSHVRCPDCAYCYNGKTGRSNLIPAIIFVTVPLVGILAILGAILYIVASRLGWFG
jgi:ribosomal protein S27E